MIDIEIKCNPPKSTAQASNKILKTKEGRYFVGKMHTSKAKQVENTLISFLMPFVPEKPLDGALSLNVVWAYPWRTSEPKKNKKDGYKYCDTRPDIDNIMKMIGDTMTRLGFWFDDSQIAELYFKKMWCESPKIIIKIKNL